MTPTRPWDVLCVGDVVTDTAIELIQDANTITYEGADGPWLAMRSGAKLPFAGHQTFDAAGNASNAAVACTRLGLRAALATDVGKDDTGRRITERLREHGVDTDLVHVHPEQQTNHHFVLRHGAERTILVRHHDFAYRWTAPSASGAPRWVYFSSLSEHAAAYQDEIADWLGAHPEVRLVFQPGTLQVRSGVGPLRAVYRRSEVVVMNREEAVTVTGGDHADVHDLLARLHAVGPAKVVITDGPDGAYASDGDEHLWMPTYPDPAPPVERTGAGDAFAATLAAALIRGESWRDALRWAPVNSMNVVQHVGGQAGLLPLAELEARLARAPDSYEPVPF
ncbi:carbohydrate kinase family protein [Actinomycetospora chibensis]|uniref:Carbohydrate kinase family protein n=1 Tax=Actinomycetospora chibensis TaxID=663606 RepID=A0ABV9RPE9_9PSEU|nr:carbohydrate kinase family protein [Actinomycetospora chibensis]MDD7922230.1 carbohydrate kinase family protein [Actinomycetospora chibensis]